MDQADSVLSTPPTNTSANNPPGGPEETQDATYVKTDHTPEEIFQTLERLRTEAEAEIERLLSFLDELDGDSDLEAYLTGYSNTGNDDREGDDSDHEPSLGWSEFEAKFGCKAPPADLDVELDDCDDEDDPGENGVADEDGLHEQGLFSKFFGTVV